MSKQEHDRDATLKELSQLFEDVARAAGKLPFAEAELKTSLLKTAADCKKSIDQRRKSP
jgi:hypothetical protein